MVSRFRTPNWVKRHHRKMEVNHALQTKEKEVIKKGIAQFKVANPLVSIVIPAYNEEEAILGTIASFAALTPIYPTELLVINNNSTDNTQQILDEYGVSSIFEKQQGRTYARQTGLLAARGKYILSADADSLYPKDWGNAFVQTLIDNPDIAIVYGRYSFIPSNNTNRLWLGIHEMMGEFMFKKRKGLYKCVNAVGFNTAFRKSEALAIGGYDPEKLAFANQRCEDGWLAETLYHHFGTIELVPTKNRVWTSDRRLLMEGNLMTASLKRIGRYLNGTNLEAT